MTLEQQPQGQAEAAKDKGMTAVAVATQRTSEHPIDALKRELNTNRAEIEKSILKNDKGKAVLTFERLCRVLVNATARNDQILKCTPVSIVRCVKAAAELGLELCGQLGEAWIVPFKNEATFIIGYRGLIALAKRAGVVKSIHPQLVYENDHFEVNLADNTVVHKPPRNLRERGDLTGVYAIATLPDGSKQIELMSREQVDAIRNRSKAKDAVPWVEHYEEMARKTVVRRLSKYIGLSLAALEEETSSPPEFVATQATPALAARSVDADGVVTEG